MVGKYYLKIWNKWIQYELQFERRISVLKGNGGTGKSTLIDLIAEYLRYHSRTGVHADTNIKDMHVLHYNTDNWVSLLREHHESVFFADEDFPYLTTAEFNDELSASGSYLVCVSRENMGRLSYAIDSVYYLKSDIQGHKTYTRMYNMYVDEHCSMKPVRVITEDLKSGHDIIEHIVNVDVISAGGNANVQNTVKEHVGVALYVIVDGAAYGQFISGLLAICDKYKNIKVLAPECFEWLLLNSYAFVRYLTDELTATYKYADSIKYGTWENYYEDLLRSLVQRFYKGHYNKESWDDLFSTFKSRRMLGDVRRQLYDLDNSVIDIRP